MDTQNFSLNEQTAVLSAQIQSSDGWYQLLPAGQFKARDGRPHDVSCWIMNAEIAENLIKRVRLSNQDVVIDYDHLTFTRAKTGQGEALAAGRFSADEIQYRENSGLWIKPRWTPRATKHIEDGEYLFLSAVFSYDKSGTPTELRMAALTNDPGVVGMQSIAKLAAEHYQDSINSFNNTKENPPMDTLINKLLSALGITVADGEKLTEEQLNQALEKVNALQHSVATLSAKAEIDLDQYVPKAAYDGVISQLATLNAQASTQQIDQLISQARQDGRVNAAECDYLTQYGKQKGVVALSAMLDARTPIAALTSIQTQQTKVTDTKTAVLSAEEKQIAEQLGISEAEFLKEKGEQNG